MSSPRTLKFSVDGMTCEHCASTLAAALRSRRGIQQAHVSFVGRSALLSTDGTVSAADVIEIAAAQGFAAAQTPATPSSEALTAPRVRDSNASDFDLVIIGSGSAAFAAALRASELGARTAIIERGTLGGTCVNVGCVPSKTLIRAAEAVHGANHPRFAGVVSSGGVADFRALMAEKQELVDGLRQAKYADVLATMPNVALLRGEARFIGPGRVSVNGAEIRAARFVVATGMRPSVAEIPGLEQVGVLTSTDALALDRLPESLIVLGGRFVALELGQAFSRLGTRVTLVQRSSHLLPTEDDDVTEELERLLVAEGLQVLTGAQVLRAGAEHGRRLVEVERRGERAVLDAEQILVATGRRPNTDGLGLDTIGAALGAACALAVSETLETSAPGVFAAGDVIGEPAFVYAAAYEGRLAAENALGTNRRQRDYTALPAVVFTDPQLATVGLNEKRAMERGIEVDVAKLPFIHVPRALAAHDTRGFVKLLRRRGTDELVGAVILAPEAGDLIMEPALAIRHGLSVTDLASAFHPYLTRSEAIKLAAQTFSKDVAKLSCCAA